MQQIGKYQLIEQIGVGGFGEVFKGFDPYIKRHVAIKTCSSKSDEIRSRFFQEAEIAGNLHHRNITTVYDFGVENELPYLIQEYLSGEDLDVKIRRKDFLPFAEKLFYLIQIARGLGAAHGQGVMHRDIKPANIRILEDGTVKIMDFGIAKLAQQQTGLTQTGMTLGTAAYLSPEQIRGDSMDVRTDIFSFGVLAYELLAYERPFQGEQISAVLYQLLNNDPRPITECWPDAPPEVVELIDRCLQKVPSRRFQDGADLLRALEGIQRRGRKRTDVYGQVKPKAEPPTVRLDSAAAAQASDSQKGRGLDEFDLTGSTPSVQAEPALARAETPQRLSPRSGSRRASSSSNLSNVVAIGVALVLFAGLGGWWLGNRDSDGPNTDTPSMGAENNSEVPEPSVEDVSAKTGSASADGSVTPAAQAAAPEAPQVAKGRLLVSRPPWTDKMTVQVERTGKVRQLNRRRSFRLKPGTYDLHFVVDEPGYKVEKSIRARVEEGADRGIQPPIQRPAGLTVVATPGSPQAEIWLAGSPLGSTPLRDLLFEPAQYVIEVRPRGATDSSGSLTGTFELRSGKVAIVTFNLGDERLEHRYKDVGSGKS